MDEALQKAREILRGYASKGGHARAAKLSPERKRAIARKANRVMNRNRKLRKAAA